MFFHLFINNFKILLKNKTIIFWASIFPFVLGTLFYFAFANINDISNSEIIPIAIVNNEYFNEDIILKEVIENLSTKGENQVFDTKYVNNKEADELLLNSDIDGYIVLNESNSPKLIVSENGISQTTIKLVLDEYYMLTNAANRIVEYDIEAVQNGILESLFKETNYIYDNSIEKIDFSLNYFFVLIAMACLYGSFISLEMVKNTEANLSSKGARMCMAPVNKFKVVLAGLIACYTIQIVTLALLFIYFIFILNINFSSQIIPTMILAALGCFAGAILGVFVGVSNKKSDTFKLILLQVSIMLCCFFAGMMGTIDIKLFFDETFPIFSMINPINIITDGLYSLYAYTNLDVYYSYLIRILVFSIILVVLSFVFIRRKKYDSI